MRCQNFELTLRFKDYVLYAVLYCYGYVHVNCKAMETIQYTYRAARRN